MQTNTQIIALIIHANLFVQLILVILALLSIISWSIIFIKSGFLTKVNFSNYIFLKKFKNSNNISQLYASMDNNKNHLGISALFFNAIGEYNKFSKNKPEDKSVIITNIERNLSATIDKQMNVLEHKVTSLASFASISPYIGLLGTVWGIMHAFLGLSSAHGTSINLVAPGIAEALIATAAGLIVAIPAYFFYNKFTATINNINNQMYAFSDDLLNMVSQYIYMTKTKVTIESNI